MSQKLIYVLDDEADLCELVRINLERSSFQAETFTTGSEFFRALRTKKPDLVVLDLMLPGEDGIEILKYLRSSKNFRDLAVLILSARGDVLDRVLGLELGADDYLGKPFSVKELIARVKAILRRKNMPAEKETEKICIGEKLEIDLKKHSVLLEGKKIELSSTEFRILTILARHPGWVYSREKLLELLWKDEKAVTERTIDVHIRNLRTKLDKFAGLIQNVRGAGYKLEE